MWQNPAQIVWGRTSELLKPEHLEAMYGAPLRQYRADDGSAVLAVKLRERHVSNERR